MTAKYSLVKSKNAKFFCVIPLSCKISVIVKKILLRHQETYLLGIYLQCWFHCLYKFLFPDPKGAEKVDPWSQKLTNLNNA